MIITADLASRVEEMSKQLAKVSKQFAEVSKQFQEIVCLIKERPDDYDEDETENLIAPSDESLEGPRANELDQNDAPTLDEVKLPIAEVKISKLLMIDHMEFIIPANFTQEKDLKAHIFQCLPHVLFRLKEFHDLFLVWSPLRATWILPYFKTRGRVFFKGGENDEDENNYQIIIGCFYLLCSCSTPVLTDSTPILTAHHY